MNRKIYSTAHERKIDQLIGFFAFPIVNVPLWMLAFALAANLEHELQLIPLILPWVVNGSLLIIMFIFRPHIGVGYLVSIGIIIMGVMALSSLFLAACFGAALAGSVTSAISEQVGAIACFISFPLLFLGGLFFLGYLGLGLLSKWWSSPETNKEDIS